MSQALFCLLSTLLCAVFDAQCPRCGASQTGMLDGRTLSAAQERICEVRKALLRAKLPFGAKAAQPMSLDDYEFKHEKGDYNVFWDVRKGLIPIVGAARETGARHHIFYSPRRMPGDGGQLFPWCCALVCVGTKFWLGGRGVGEW